MSDVVNVDVAAAEFARFVDMMDLDIGLDSLDAEDLTEYDKGRRRMLRAIISGALVINDDGEAVYTPQNQRSKHKDPIIFHERTGASLMAQDGKKKNQDVRKTYAIMGDLCRLPAGVFSGLVGKDIKICETIYSFLMD